MFARTTIAAFLDELASSSPAPGGGSVAALAGALGAALTSMVCNLTIGKKKYTGVEADMRKVLNVSENLRLKFSTLAEEDTAAFNKVMEARALPRDNDAQKVLRSAAIEEATKEATLVPLEVMKHCIDALALAREVAEKGNANSLSDAGVSALMLHAACEGASLNVKINLRGVTDTEFFGWKSEEVESLLKTSRLMAEKTQLIVTEKMRQ